VGSHRRAVGARVILEYLENMLLGEIEAVGDHARVKALGKVTLGLVEELAAKEHGRSSSIAGDVVLSGGGACDKCSSRMLDLHLVEEDVAILGQLDLTRATHEHLKRAARA
jgi:hypothetical protein